LELVQDKGKNALDELVFGLDFEQRVLKESEETGDYLQNVVLDFEQDGALLIGEVEKLMGQPRENAIDGVD
jgi:hypothetical protein